MCHVTSSGNTKKRRFVNSENGDGAPTEYQRSQESAADSRVGEHVMTSSDTHKSNHSSGSNTESSSKMLGALLTSLVALYVGMNRFNMTFYLMEQSSGAGSGGTGSASQPLACCGILVVLALRKVWNDRVHSMVENCSHQVDTVMMRVSSNKTLTRIKSSSMRLLDLATGRHEGGAESCLMENRRTPKLSIPTAPFVSSEMIAELSLIDIKDLFRYVLVMNQTDFDRHAFLSEINNFYCREVIHAMDRAVLSSRGESSIAGPSIATTINEVPVEQTTDCAALDPSEMDALYFVAVICIFAEWRTVRLVPPVGYHRYSIGMGLAKRDLIQNAQKIEIAVHQYLHEQEKMHAHGNVNTEHVVRTNICCIDLLMQCCST